MNSLFNSSLPTLEMLFGMCAMRRRVKQALFQLTLKSKTEFHPFIRAQLSVSTFSGLEIQHRVKETSLALTEG